MIFDINGLIRTDGKLSYYFFFRIKFEMAKPKKQTREERLKKRDLRRKKDMKELKIMMSYGKKNKKRIKEITYEERSKKNSCQ